MSFQVCNPTIIYTIETPIKYQKTTPFSANLKPTEINFPQIAYRHSEIAKLPNDLSPLFTYHLSRYQPRLASPRISLANP